MSINKTLSFFLLILSFTLIINLVRDIWRLTQIEKRTVQVEENLELIKKENQELQQTKEHYQSEEFLEEQIRNRLQMNKPGETVLILPEELVEERPEKSPLSDIGENKEGKSNWQKWLELFK